MDDFKKVIKTAKYELIEKIPTFLKHFSVYKLQGGMLVCGVNVPKGLPISPEVNISDVWDVTGSPLEFSYANLNLNASVLDVPWLEEEQYYVCIPSQKAREFMNLYIKDCVTERSNRPQLWFLCAGKTVFLGVQVKFGWWSRTVITQMGRKSLEIHSFEIKELLDNHKKTARMSSVQKESMQLKCTYNVYENLNSKVSLEMSWQNLVLEPPINAKTMVYIQSQVCSAEELWRQLHQIHELLQILKSSHLECDPIQLIGDGNVLNVVSDPSYLNCPSCLGGGISINKAMEEGATLDAADKLWLALRDCKDHEELEHCFKVVFHNIISGEIKPYIRYNNTSSVAYIIQEMMTGLRKVTPVFEGTTSIKFLIEMGISKLVNDYMHIFLSTSVVTVEKLKNNFDFSRRCVANEAIDWLTWLAHTHAALEILLLAEKFLALSMIQLCPLALTALDTFHKSYNFDDLLNKQPLLFEAPIATVCVQSILPRYFSDWSLVVQSESQRRKVLSMFYFNIRNIYPPSIQYIVPDGSDCEDATYEFSEMVCYSDKMW